MIWLALLLTSLAFGWLFGHGDLEANLRSARASASAEVAGLLLGPALGAMGRDRLRLRRTYASPSLAHAAKLLALLSLGIAVTFVLSPVGWDPFWLHAGVTGTASGLALWSANLPPRI